MEYLRSIQKFFQGQMFSVPDYQRGYLSPVAFAPFFGVDPACTAILHEPNFVPWFP